MTAKLCRKELDECFPGFDECFPGFDDSILVFPARTRIQGLNFWEMNVLQAFDEVLVFLARTRIQGLSFWV